MIRIIIVLLLAGLWAGNHFLGWRFWLGVAGVGVAIWLFGRPLLGWALERLVRLPFRKKGEVLRGAALTVHGITALPTDGERPSYEIEVTITPRGDTQTPFRHWEPDSLAVMQDTPDAEKSDDPEKFSAGDVDKAEVFSGGQWESEGMKYPGEQRVRLHVRLDKPRASIRLGYYFEILPAIALPEHEPRAQHSH